ncbi:MAG: DUF4922 domain-containing protein [Candidatus Anammoxibacter sp.]
MCNEYIESINREFKVSDSAKLLFGKIMESQSQQRDEILKDMDMLVKDAGLSYALTALFRQQVKCGFVMADPLLFQNNNQKTFYDQDTNITFRLQWNPFRERRHDHAQLTEMGIIANNVDADKLVNKDKNGKACYLCETNIELQNPKEILYPINLATESFNIGANFAFITNNHFTVINTKHRPQQYRNKIIEALNDFVDKADGYFRAIYNGLAGASIKEHEHLQITPDEFPIEKVNVGSMDIVYKDGSTTVLRPKYYLPVLIVDGKCKDNINIAVHRIIDGWLTLDSQFHSINIIATKSAGKETFRTFVILRDKRKLKGKWKRGAMAAFETGGNIVLSCRSRVDGKDKVDEKHSYDNANLEIIKQMLKDIAPDEKSCSRLIASLTSF